MALTSILGGWGQTISVNKPRTRKKLDKFALKWFKLLTDTGSISLVCNSLLTGATGHCSHSQGREKSHFLTANRCLRLHHLLTRWERSSAAGFCGVFFLSVSGLKRGLSRVIRGWRNAGFTAGQHARARSARVPSAPPSVRLLEWHEADDAVRALTFCRPFTPAARLWLSQSCLLKKRRAAKCKQTGGGRRWGRGGDEHVSRNIKPQGCSVWFKVNVINAPIQNS